MLLQFGRLRKRSVPSDGVQDAVETAAETCQLCPAQSSKLRGQEGCTVSRPHGECGWLALPFLKQRGYSKDGDRTFLHDQLRELRFLSGSLRF